MRPHSSLSRHDRGITLTETIVTVGIMAILSLVVAEIFIATSSLTGRQSASYAIETSAALTLKTIAEQSQGAGAIETAHTFGADTYTTSSTTLVVRLPSIDSNDNVIAGSYDYVAFYRHSTNQTEIYSVTDAAAGSVRPAGVKLLAAKNITMTFRYNAQDMVSANRVSIYLVNQQTHRGTTLTTRGWTSVFLHNIQ